MSPIPEPTRIVSDGPVPRVPQEWRRRRDDRPHAQPIRDWWMPALAFDLALVNKVAALAIWLFACVTTWQFIAAFGVNDPLISIPAAVLLQALLSVVEFPYWRRRRDFVAGVAVIADTLINAGGVWPWMSRLDDTPPWRMLAEAFTLDPRLSAIPAFVLCLVFGYVLAAAPERVWNRKL